MREVDQFINYMSSVKGASEGTLQVYEEELTRFLSFVEKPVTMIDIDDAYEYLNYCVREKHNSPATRARKVSTIKSFFTFFTKNVYTFFVSTFNFISSLSNPLPSISKEVFLYILRPRI